MDANSQITNVSPEAAFRDKEQRYSLAIQGLSVGLWDWNLVTTEIYWSPRFLEIVGITDPAFIPRLDYFKARLHPEDHDRTMNMLFKHIEREGPFDAEYRLRREDGNYIWIHAKGQALWDEAGKPLRMVGCVEDITGKKETERDIERYIEALKRSNEELDDFAYIASHDLKEPLRGLVNKAMFLKEDFGDKLDDITARRLDRMTYLCQRMEKLIDDLLYFSRLGRQELATQPTDLNEVIKDIQMMMETTLQQANAVIAIPQPLPTIVCDLPRITEVFRNLITNAVKYNKSPEKHIEIGCADLEKLTGGNGKQGIAFYVRDNGIGIPEQFYGDIFRIFKRLNDEDDSVKGTGVGLTFVRKIIERHGGNVWPVSKVGDGTTFYFTLNQNKETRI